jgi:tetratricopeptide (TPR) repeat protein
MDASQAIQVALDHHRAGRLSDAEIICRKILSQNPNQIEAVHLLGILAGQTGHVDAAIALFGRAIQANPDFAEAHFNLGNALAQKGEMDAHADLHGVSADKTQIERVAPSLQTALNGAVAAFQRAIELKPGFAKAYINLGNALLGLGEFDRAIAAYREAIQLKPNIALAHYNLGNALCNVSQFDAAIAACRRAIHLDPDDAKGHYNLGNALYESGELAEATASFQRAVELQPDFAEAHCNLGNVFLHEGRVEESIASSRRVIELVPSGAQAHHNLSVALLLIGEFEEGWREYEWRWEREGYRSMDFDFRRSRWTGDDLAGRTILLRAEQGLGNTLQFVRYLPMVAGRGGRILLEVQPELIGLLKQLPHVERWIACGEPAPHFDVQCPLMSLPRLFGTTLQNIPRQSPPLRADPDLTRAWGSRMKEESGALKVGLVWAGNPTNRNDRNRSMPPKDLCPLARIPGVRFYGLRKHPASEEPTTPPPELRLIDWAADIKDFADTAALVANLDLVISVDTSVAHLAGAMGKPVWVMLAFAPDWRWMRHRDDTPWYPTMRLFRQPGIGDWQGVIEQVAKALSAFGAI